MRNVENKKSLFAGVGADSKYRCNLCGHLTKSYGQRCPHCGTVVSIYTATDVTFDATSYRQYVAAKSVIFKYHYKYQTFIRVEGKPQGEKPNSLYTLSEV